MKKFIFHAAFLVLAVGLSGCFDEGTTTRNDVICSPEASSTECSMEFCATEKLDRCYYVVDGSQVSCSDCNNLSPCVERTVDTCLGTSSSGSSSGSSGGSSSGSTSGDNSCQWAFDGECDEGTYCDVGTDSDDCDGGSSSGSTSGDNSCQWAYDGECDEGTYCDVGTDSDDCDGGSSSGGSSSGGGTNPDGDKITIFLANSSAVGTVRVYLDGSQVASFTHHLTSGDPTCGTPSNGDSIYTTTLSAGSHTIEAVDSDNNTWGPSTFTKNDGVCLNYGLR